MKRYYFEVEIYKKVKILPTGEEGVALTLSVCDGKVLYFVRSRDYFKWWKAKQVKEIQKTGCPVCNICQ
jgi:hypothetical protein